MTWLASTQRHRSTDSHGTAATASFSFFCFGGVVVVVAGVAICVSFSHFRWLCFRLCSASGMKHMYPPSSSVHVSNISPSFSEEIAREVFSRFGNVQNVRFFECVIHVMLSACAVPHSTMCLCVCVCVCRSGGIASV